MSLRARQPFDRFINGRSRADVANFSLEDAKIDSLSDIELEDEKDGYLQPTFVNTAKRAQNILGYRKSILEALQIKPFKMLKDHHFKNEASSAGFLKDMPSWPVNPRRKPSIRAPETVLDMPGIDRVDAVFYHHVIDWGKQGQIATIFHGEVHLWSCVHGQLSNTKTNKTIADCVKWNRSGTHFAVARIEPELSIIDGESLKVLRTVRCKCISCMITSIEWSRDDHVIAGCSNGSLTIISRTAEIVKYFYKWLDGRIVDLKFSCYDKYLLVTTHVSTTSIFSWPMEWNSRQDMLFRICDEDIRKKMCIKVLRTVRCKCISCMITSIEWSRDDHVIAGCSNGSLTIISRTAEIVKYFYKWLDGRIVDLKFSCYDKYLLVTTHVSTTSIFSWPMEWNSRQDMLFRICDEDIRKKMCIKSAAWHPWRESILVVGEMDNGVAVWNVNNQKLVDYDIVKPYFKKSETCILDYLTFNPLSAELLVSFYHENPDPESNNGCNFLTIFSDLHTRVDEIRYHIGRVPHVLWDGTGTKLATVGTDENLALWNFFGTESDTERTFHRLKRFCGLFDAARQFGSCIR